MEPVKPIQLQMAARIADALVYVAGVAGILAGGLLLRSDQIGFAVVAWALTFVSGAGLRLAAWVARALAELLVSSRQVEQELRDLKFDRAVAVRDPDAAVPDPYRRWGHH